MSERLQISYAMLNLLETGKTSGSVELIFQYLQECGYTLVDVESLDIYKKA